MGVDILSAKLRLCYSSNWFKLNLWTTSCRREKDNHTTIRFLGVGHCYRSVDGTNVGKNTIAPTDESRTVLISLWQSKHISLWVNANGTLQTNGKLTCVDFYVRQKLWTANSDNGCCRVCYRSVYMELGCILVLRCTSEVGQLGHTFSTFFIMILYVNFQILMLPLPGQQQNSSWPN